MRLANASTLHEQHAQIAVPAFAEVTEDRPIAHRIAKNPIYVVMQRAIIDWLVDQRRLTLSYPGQNRVAFDSHVAIFEAIKAHDPELAAPACART